MPKGKNFDQPGTGAYLARFRQKYGLTVSKMCALFGISTQAKFNSLIKPNDEGEPNLLDPTVALILRLYETHEHLIPLNSEFTLKDTFSMLQRVFGAEEVNESVFGLLMGRSPGSGYRWLSGTGNATPQVGIILERFCHMLSRGFEEPEVCLIWLDIVHKEYRARGLKPPLGHIDALGQLMQKYPLKYKHLA